MNRSVSTANKAAAERSIAKIKEFYKRQGKTVSVFYVKKPVFEGDKVVYYDYPIYSNITLTCRPLP